MANQNRFIRNIHSASNHRAARTTGKYASKGINKTAKWLTTDHTGTNFLITMMEFQQKMNYSTAYHNLLIRRLSRFNQRTLQSVISWVADYLHYAWDMLLGFIGPIISMIFWSIFRVVVIVVCNVIFFYVLYQLIIT